MAFEAIPDVWSANRSYHWTERYRTGVRYTLQREPSADSPRDLIVHSHRMAGIVLSEGLATRRLPQLLRTLCGDDTYVATRVKSRVSARVPNFVVHIIRMQVSGLPGVRVIRERVEVDNLVPNRILRATARDQAFWRTPGCSSLFCRASDQGFYDFVDFLHRFF